MCTIWENQLLTVPVSANGVSTRLIIDTGSSVNIISADFAKKLSLGSKQNPTGIFIKGISGNLFSPIGETAITLEFASTRIAQKFLIVKDSPYELLGGLPFCRTAHLLIDFLKKTLQIEADVFELQVESGAPVHNDVLTARCKDHVRIEPRTEMVIEVKIPRNGPHLVEPNTTLKNGLQVARTLTNVVCGVGIVRVANPTNSPVTVHRDTRLGWAASIHDVQLGITAPGDSCDGEELHFDIGPHLQPSEEGELLSLMRKFRHLFTGKHNPIQRTNITEHVIDTGDSPPIRQQSYRHSPFEREIAHKQVDEMLRDEVIRESYSPWSSPVVLVRKPDGGWRFCVDFRRVNAVTKKDVHPLPRVDDILDVLQGAKYFTTLDLTSGYWQIGIREEDKPKTAFTCGRGLYEFNVVPFGLCNAPATFQRMINKVLSGLLWKVCLAYLDDMVIFSKTIESHLKDLEKVFGALEQANLRLKPEKCKFAQEEIKYLGHVLTGTSIRPDPKKVAAIEKLPAPTTRKDRKSVV